MKVVQRKGQRLRLPPPRPPRYEMRENGEAPRPSSRRRPERHFRWVIIDNWTFRIVAYCATKRLARKELARWADGARKEAV